MAEKNRITRYGAPHLPISRSVRAGDFIFTCALGDHYFDPADVRFDEQGNVLSDGADIPERSVEEETHGIMREITAALEEAGAGLADVVELTAWLKDPRDFIAFNSVYAEYFADHAPVRSVFEVGFMFDCRIEIKAVAYKPL